MMSLAELAKDPSVRVLGDDRVAFHSACADSRAVTPGSLFVSIADDAEVAKRHADDAVANGAVAVAARAALDVSVPCVVAPRPGSLLGFAAERLEGNPTSRLTCIGVTGTNGKTTTTQLVEQALCALGRTPALIGTGVLRGPLGSEGSVFTTPFGDVISRFARRSLDAGATHLVMEVSSHALDQGRADGVAFGVGAFTNLTRDHLDYHETMESYGASKARFFTEFALQYSVIHVGDAFGRELAARARGHVVRVAVDGPADVHVAAVRYAIDGIVADVVTPWGAVELTSPLVGRHNLENLLVALSCLVVSGVSLSDAVRGLADARGAEGRLERVDHESIGVFVDYAHTPDAIARVLAALRPLTPGRLFVVFGCGGDRDRGKRPEMARAAVMGADVVVVTSDNPRTEEPNRIVEDVLGGVPATSPRIDAADLSNARTGHAVVVDRHRAIEDAIRAANPGDTVLLAGKGHEDYQIVGTTKHPFDDRIEARAALALRGEAR